MRFANRVEAGRGLARRLAHLRRLHPVVVGLPRGGVPVAFEVARALHAPLDALVVRKLGVPSRPELAMGAVGEGGISVRNADVLRTVHIGPDQLATAERAARAEVDRRVRHLRAGRPRTSLVGRTVVIVDDGIATGATIRAACRVARAQGSARVVVAAPVAPSATVAALREVADEVVCLHAPAMFLAVGEWYDDFTQTTDEEVITLLARAADDDQPGTDADVVVEAGPLRLPGHLAVPESAAGVVVFAHGSGSSRQSPRNRYVADRLNQAGLATLLFDLLSPEEEIDRRNVFDVELLARRLVQVIGWVRHRREATNLPVGLFGASTGAAAALWAATMPDSGAIAAIVARGGRPDLALRRLNRVRAPTLLIVGGRDETVLDLNRAARAHLRCPNRLAVVPAATHLFTEPGALRTVSDLARDWFVQHLGGPDRPQPTTNAALHAR